VDKKEGILLKQGSPIYPAGEITLYLNNGIPDESIKVLVNGEERASFKSTAVWLEVKTYDFIEIDARGCKADTSIDIVPGKNVVLTSELSELKTAPGIVPIGGVRVK